MFIIEKDYFKDRSPHCTQKDLVPQGSVVYICLKENQRKINSDDMSLLTKVIVVTHLSKKQSHPRGCKIKGYPIRNNINPTPEQIKKVVEYYHTHRRLIESGENKILSDKFVVGRCVYLLDEKGNKL